MRKYLKLLYTAFAMALPTCAMAQKPDPNFQIYLCFGQSNMEGAGVIEGQDTLYVDPRFRSMCAVDDANKGWHQGQWRTAYPPQARPHTNLSVVDYFGRKMVESLPEDVRVGVITVAVGGANINLFDTDSCKAYINDKKTPEWLRNMAHAYGDNPYGRLVKLAKRAQQDGVIRGILLHQGETNNGDPSWPQRVNKIYRRLLADLGLNAKTVPLLVGETARTEQGGQCGLMNSVIDTIASVIPTAHVISSEGLQQRGDGLHFTPNSYRIFGRRYADTMLSLLGVKKDDKGWTGTWATAIEPVDKNNMPKSGTLTNKSVRQIVRVSKSGNKLRLRLSNAYSKTPIEIKKVFIADAADSSDIVVHTAKKITFKGKENITIAAEHSFVSDPVSYDLKPLQRLAITIVYGSTPKETTGHRGARTTTYIIDGKADKHTSFSTCEKCFSWYNIAAIDVTDNKSSKGKTQGALQQHAIAAIGNSITDGRGTTTDGDNRWTDFLASTLQHNGLNIGILNLGIGGNCVIHGGLGPTALSRFTPDILRQTGVDKVIIYEGINDIGSINEGHFEHSAKELIEAYKVMIGQAHAHGLKVYGATITPFGKSMYDNSYFREAVRQTVNEWIKTSGEFDGVIDFDKLVRDPVNPHTLRSDYQSDYLHLNPKGYEAMGKFAAEIVNK